MYIYIYIRLDNNNNNEEGGKDRRGKGISIFLNAGGCSEFSSLPQNLSRTEGQPSRGNVHLAKISARKVENRAVLLSDRKKKREMGEKSGGRRGWNIKFAQNSSNFSAWHYGARLSG